jgi:hypothetical protein
VPGRRRLERHGLEDEERLPLRTHARSPSDRGGLTSIDPGPMLATAESHTRERVVLRLQQTEGNARVVQRLAGLTSALPVQRQSVRLVPKLQIRKDLFHMRGVSDVKPKDPTTPDDDDRPKFWVLDFDALVDDESSLGKALAEQKRLKQIYTGKADDETPLGWSLSNAAVNIMMSTPPGQNFLDTLHIKNLTIVLDPIQGNYGLSVKFKLNWL